MAIALLKLTYPDVEVGEMTVSSTLPQEMVDVVRNKLEAAASGVSVGGALSVSPNETSGVAATGTALFTAVVATDALTVAGVAFTCVNSGATGDQFNKGASEALSAAACAAKINANATVSKYVVATVVGATITLTATEKSALGNLITLTQTGGHITVSGAVLSGGAAIVYTSYTF